MQGITFSGLASGLDTGAIISQLMALERLPIQQMEQNKVSVQAQIDLIGTLKDLLGGLQEKARGLSEPGNFLEFASSEELEGIASISTTGAASAGSHTLEVLSLAAADRWAFNPVTDPTFNLAVTDSSVRFTVDGMDYNVQIEAANSRMSDIVAAIEAEAGDVVDASVVNTGTESDPSYRVILASRETGESHSITNLNSTVRFLTLNSTPGGPNNLVQASNAQVVIDGLLFERESNEISEALEGVSLTVSSLTDGPVTFSLNSDSTAIKEKLTSLVDSYNEIINFINAQSTFSPEGEAAGALFGDPILRTVRRELTDALFGFGQRQDTSIDDLANDTEGFSTLSLVGITLASDGTLSLDETKVDEKLEQDPNAFADLFVDADGFDNSGAVVNTPEYFLDQTADAGIAAILDRVIERMFDDFQDADGNSFQGLFSNRNNTLQEAIKRFDKQIEDKERYLEQYEQILIRRFSALEDIIGSLNAQGAALANLQF